MNQENIIKKKRKILKEKKKKILHHKLRYWTKIESNQDYFPFHLELQNMPF